MTKQQALKLYFGHDAFRPAQETLIDALLSGRDVLGVMPTGAGKSVCYQIPAVLQSGLTIVVSPLISLMKDQVAGLKEAGIAGSYINSSLSAEQLGEVLRRARAGRYKIMYVAPERLGTEAFLDFAREAGIALVAADEAHCVSQWGQDFRPSYLKIAGFLDALPERPPVGAFTATATADVKRDILRLLGLRDPLSITTGFDRPNLFFEVVKPASKAAYMSEYISERRDQCGVIYCATRKTVDAVCSGLKRNGVSAARYHAGLEDGERKQSQDDFISGKVSIIVATNAFGMGIDKPDVRFVLHYNMPKNMESYYQEAGRAGRDGAPANCTLMFEDDDIKTAEFFIASGKNKELTDKERKTVHRRDVERLDKMTRYCEIDGCLRAYMLMYFGEKGVKRCGYCGNCSAKGRRRG